MHCLTVLGSTVTHCEVMCIYSGVFCIIFNEVGYGLAIICLSARQVSIFSHLQDSKFEHFRPVVDAYVNGHFAAALVYK